MVSQDDARDKACCDNEEGSRASPQQPSRPAVAPRATSPEGPTTPKEGNLDLQAAEQVVQVPGVRNQSEGNGLETKVNYSGGERKGTLPQMEGDDRAQYRPVPESGQKVKVEISKNGVRVKGAKEVVWSNSFVEVPNTATKMSRNTLRPRPRSCFGRGWRGTRGGNARGWNNYQTRRANFSTRPPLANWHGRPELYYGGEYVAAGADPAPQWRMANGPRRDWNGYVIPRMGADSANWRDPHAQVVPDQEFQPGWYGQGFDRPRAQRYASEEHLFETVASPRRESTVETTFETENREGRNMNHSFGRRILNMMTVMATMCCGIGKYKDVRAEKRPTSKIWVNGTHLQALWDTGADLCVISWKQFNKLQVKPVLARSPNRVTDASGGLMRVRGCTRLQYTIGRHQFAHDTLVIENMKSNFIIGTDLMTAHGYTLDMGRKLIKRNEPEPRENRGKPTIVSPKQFRIEPLQATSIPIKYNGEDSDGKLWVASGKYVPEGLIEMKNGKSSIIVANATFHPIQIHRGQQICTLERIKSPKGDGKEGSKQRAPARLNSMTSLTSGSASGDLGRRLLTKTNSVVGNNVTPYGYGIKCSKQPAEVDFLNTEAIKTAVRNVPSDFREGFANLIKSFRDIFSKNDTDLGFSDAVEQKIQLVNPDKISAKPPYKTAHLLVNVVDAYITKLLRMGVIEPSNSPWSSPLMLVRKPGVSANSSETDLTKIWRVVHDYRLLNSNTIKDKYPLNTVFSLIDQVAGGAIFTLLDVSQGYWQQSLHKDSRDYTAFSVPSRGHFRYLRSAQGLSNSGPCYQRLLDKVISGIQGCHVYIDDVIIVSRNMEDHLATLKSVFERFRTYGLKLRLSKAKIATDKVTFLGYEISSKTGVRAGELKIKALTDCKEPHSVTDLRSFIGLASFFRRTIPFFSHMASPLTALLRKDSGYSGGQMPQSAVKAFHALKQELGKRPCLRAVDFTKDFICTVDSSATGSAACLSQVINGVEHPCLYISKTNSAMESKRSAFLLESNGIIWAMRTFSPLIRGGVTKIRTDHRPLSTVDKSSTPILDKVHAELDDFSYTMEYLPGKVIPVDCLSRQGLHADCKLCHGVVAERDPNSKAITVYSPPVIDPKPELGTKLSVFELSSRKSPDISQFVRADKNNAVQITQPQLLDMQQADKWTKALVCFLRFGGLPDMEPLRNFVMTHGPTARIINGLVGITVKGQFRYLAPLNLRSTLLHMCHDHVLSGHQNAAKTLNRLSRWYWPNMNVEVEQYIKNCITCQRVNQTNQYVKLPLQALPEAKQFNHRIHLDILGSPYPSSGEMGAKYCLVCCDAFSSFVRIIPLRSKNTEDVSKAFLETWVSDFGIPTFCTMDSGSEFISKLFRKISTTLGCELRYATVGHSSANGQVENRNKGIVNYIRKYVENAENWVFLMPHVTYALNTSSHRDKLISPYEMVFGLKPTLAVDYVLPEINYSEELGETLLDRHFRIRQSVREYKKEAFASQAKFYNARMNVRNFQVGDTVFYMHNHTGKLFRKFQHKWDGPARIVSLEKDGNVKIENLQTGRRFDIHCNRLKPGSAENQIYRTPSEARQEDPDVLPSDLPLNKDIAESGAASESGAAISQSGSYTGRITRSRSRLQDTAVIQQMSSHWIEGGPSTVMVTQPKVMWGNKRWEPGALKCMSTLYE